MFAVTRSELSRLMRRNDAVSSNRAALIRTGTQLVQLGQAVYIQADVAITYGQFMEVMDAVKAAGAQVNLVTLPKPPDAR